MLTFWDDYMDSQLNLQEAKVVLLYESIKWSFTISDKKWCLKEELVLGAEVWLCINRHATLEEVSFWISYFVFLVFITFFSY